MIIAKVPKIIIILCLIIAINVFFVTAQTNEAKDSNQFSFIQVIVGLGAVIAAFLAFLLGRIPIYREEKKRYKRQSAVLVKSLKELQESIRYILNEWQHGPKPDFLDVNLIVRQSQNRTSNLMSDENYKKYMLVRTVYHLCVVLAWFELYRIDLTYLKNIRGKLFEKYHGKIEQCLSDTYGSFSESAKIKDMLILREEQRAIGEKLLTIVNNETTVVGYAAFCENLFKRPRLKSLHHVPVRPDPVRDQNFWIFIATRFISEDVGDSSKDFRFLRLKLLVIYLIELIDVLERHGASLSYSLDKDLYNAHKQLKEEIRKYILTFEYSKNINYLLLRDAIKTESNFNYLNNS